MFSLKSVKYKNGTVNVKEKYVQLSTKFGNYKGSDRKNSYSANLAFSGK